MICCCCLRTIIKNDRAGGKDYAPGIGAIWLGNDKLCCGECAKDLDEFGLFPEERSVACKQFGGAYCDEPKKYKGE